MKIKLKKYIHYVPKFKLGDLVAKETYSHLKYEICAVIDFNHKPYTIQKNKENMKLDTDIMEIVSKHNCGELNSDFIDNNVVYLVYHINRYKPFRVKNAMVVEK